MMEIFMTKVLSIAALLLFSAVSQAQTAATICRSVPNDKLVTVIIYETAGRLLKADVTGETDIKFNYDFQDINQSRQGGKLIYQLDSNKHTLPEFDLDINLTQPTESEKTRSTVFPARLNLPWMKIFGAELECDVRIGIR
jgi:hypothetical protein